MSIEVKDSKMIDVTRIHPNDWNPNEQSDETFNQLVEEIKEDGFDHPINLVPCSCDKMDGEHYMIIGGEHRWKVAKLEEMTEVPSFIHADWDDKAQKLKTVRRNLLTGKLNPAKFTALVKGLEDVLDPMQMPHLFGFTDSKEFDRFILKDKDERDKSFLDGLMAETKREKFAVESLTDIISEIFASAAETLDQNYMFFAHRGKNHLVALFDDDSWKTVLKMTKHLDDTGELLTDFIKAAISAKLE